MPPPGAGKRKRGDRTYSGDDGSSRPSPYRPGNTNLAQHGYAPQQSYGPPDGGYNRGRGRGRGGRGGARGGAPRGGLDGSTGSYHHHHHTRGAYPQQSQTQSSQQYQQQNQQAQQDSRPPSRPDSQPSSQQQPAAAAAAGETADTAAVQAKQPVAAEPAAPRVVVIDENFDEPEGPIPSFPYDYVTDDVVATWEEKGREALLNTAAELIKTKDVLHTNTLFLELLRSALDGRLHPSEAGRFVRDILAAEADRDGDEAEMSEAELLYVSPTSAFLDTVSLLSDKDKKSRRLSVLLYRTEISHDTMREELDSDLLVILNLVRPVFNKAFIRHQTNVLYRQSNYNLLREETEGYSKLLTELFTTSEDVMPSASTVNATFERVRSMIGTFDLDVGRTLDITLDVFAAVIVKHHRFFVKFLRVSSWWPEDALSSPNAPSLPYWATPESDGLDMLSEEAQSELDQRREARDVKFWDYVRQLSLSAKGKGIQAFYHLHGLDFDISEPSNTTSTSEEDKKWREITGTCPPVGNKVAAQILGFKLRYYSSKARDSQDELPLGLVHLTALLIKIGFISLRDIYPHLWPEDKDMDEVRKQLEKEKAERDKKAMPGAEMNALQLAGALSDDTVPPSAAASTAAPAKAKESEKPAANDGQEKGKEAGKEQDNLAEPKDAKIELLKALLSIGAIPDALYLIGRFPWVLDLVPDLPSYIHRIIHHSIHKLYDPIRPLQEMDELRKPARVVDPEQSGVAKGSLRRIDKTEKRSLRWLRLEEYKEEESVFYRYYWDDWDDNVPVCQTTDDLFTLCDTFVNLSGVRIGQDPLLLSKLIRIGARSLGDDPSESNRTRWIDLCKRLLVPALSLTRRNPGVMNEMYHNILKHLPIATRYNIYSEWYMGATSRLAPMKIVFALTEAETKDLLRKVSKSNVKQSARPLAKVSTSSPGTCFMVAIKQMEVYPNLVDVFVECARYLTDLGYDVLAWATLTALSRPGREKISSDGLFTSGWLQSLSSFIGRIYWRYKLLDADPILLYLENQLVKGEPNDLKVLEDMLRSMGGITELTYSDNSILALAGGPLLQKQTLISMHDKRHESRTTAERLRVALARSRTVGPFLVALAQEAQSRLYKVGQEGHVLKLQGNVHDEMFRLLTQYYEFVKTWLPMEQFHKFIPDVSSLINYYGIETRLAFMVSRASINYLMEEYDEEKSNGEQPSPGGDDGEAGEEDENSGKPAADPAKGPAAPDADTEMGDDQKTAAEDIDLIADPEADSPAWHPVLKNIIDQTRDTIGHETLALVGEMFYMTFWQLSLNDMLVPTDSYQEEIGRQSEKIKEINQDRSDLSINGTKKREERRAVHLRQQERLREELKEQVAKYSSFSRLRMGKEKDHWFSHTWGKHDALNGALLEHCFIPRITLSLSDALYSFKVLKLLQSQGAKNFRTMGFLDQLFNQKRLTVLFFMCTSKEAENLARFVFEVLKDLGKWHASKETFESEAYGSKRDLPGFCRRIGLDASQNQFLGYPEFRRLLFKWHGQLANALRHCLEAQEYMHIRNAITVLRGVMEAFPVVEMQAKKLYEAVSALTKNDPRDDIKLAASSLLPMLTKKERDNKFVTTASFWQTTKDGAPAAVKRSAGVTSISGGVADNDATSKKLNAAAAEFRPVNGLAVRSEKPEPEDGEINSPVVAEAPRSAASAKAAAQGSSNLATAVENSDADRTRSARGEGTPKAGTPKPEQRPDSRSSPVPYALPHAREGRLPNGRPNSSRPSHALPARPDTTALQPPRRSERGLPGRPDDRGGREARPVRDGRELPPHPAEYDRSSRAVPDAAAGRAPERAGQDRGGYERGPPTRPAPVDRERPEYPRSRDSYGARHPEAEERPTRGPPREERPTREGRERHGFDSSPRDPSLRERLPPQSDNGMPPPAPVMNPERARLLSGQPSTPGKDDSEPPSRHGRHSHSRPGSERGSRATSPVRKDERERDSRPARAERSGPGEHHHGRPALEDQRSHPLRSERDPFIGHDDRSRSSRTGPGGSEGYSRPPRDYGPPPGESQYGRLNGPEPAPTGPRGVNGSNSGGSQHSGRPSRAPSGPAVQNSPSDRQAADRQTPSGPSSGRYPRLTTSGASSRQGRPSSPTGGAAPDSPVPGVHPDRAARLGMGSGPNSPVDAPRGPSGSAPGSATRSGFPPSQPSQDTAVNERGRGDKRFASINSTLQQSGGGGNGSGPDQGANIRGRGARNPPPSPLGPGPGPGAPSGPGRYDGPPPQRDGGPPARGDLFGDGGGLGGPGGSRRGPPRDSLDGDGGRSGPQSRRGGRSPSPSSSGPPHNRGPPGRSAGGPPYQQQQRHQYPPHTPSSGPAADSPRGNYPSRRNEPREMRSRDDLSSAAGGPPPAERELRRSGRGGGGGGGSGTGGGGGDDYGPNSGNAGKSYGGRQGGNDRRDVRDISWSGGGARGGEGSSGGGGGGPGGMPPDGPGSAGRKRRSDFDDHSELKRSRRGGR